MKSVRVLVPGIKLKDGKTDAKVYGVYLSKDLAMTRFTLNKRIDQKWLEVIKESEEEVSGDPPEEETPAAEPQKLWIGFTDCDHEVVYFEGETPPVSCTQCAEVALENPNLPDAEEFDSTVEEEVIDSGPNTGEGLTGEIDESVVITAIDEETGAVELTPVEETSQVHPEPTRDEKTINEYWDEATIPEDKTRARACGFCNTEHNSKTGLFECCEDKSEWGERK